MRASLSTLIELCICSTVGWWRIIGSQRNGSAPYVERHPFRRADAGEDASVHDHRSAGARARDWRLDHDVFGGQRATLKTLALHPGSKSSPLCKRIFSKGR